MSQPIYEIVTFRTHDRFSEQDIHRRATGVQTWIEQQPGYLERSLLRGTDGEWVDLVKWSTLDHAQAAAKLIGTVEAAGAFMETIDGSTVVMRHAHPALAFNAAR